MKTAQSGKLPVSVFIIARNEDDRISNAIKAVCDWVEEVIVIDSGSDDDTVSVAEHAGARVVYNAWPGFGLQKQFGEDQCRNEWMLNLDADEFVSYELADEIKALFANGEPDHKAYSFPIAEMFPGEDKPHAWAFALSPVRLYKKSAGRYSPSPVHDRVDLKKGVTVGKLKGRVHHASVRSLSHQITKLNAYSDMQVDDLAKRGKKLPSWRVITEFPLTFLKVYITRRHFVRGFYGIATASNVALARHLRVAKHLERRKLDKQKSDQS